MQSTTNVAYLYTCPTEYKPYVDRTRSYAIVRLAIRVSPTQGLEAKT